MTAGDATDRSAQARAVERELWADPEFVEEMEQGQSHRRASTEEGASEGGVG